METKRKRVKVVMLRVDNTFDSTIRTNGKFMLWDYARVPDGWNCNHLYFISDDEIKEGDWVYNHNTNEIGINKNKDLNIMSKSFKNSYRYSKIIASTDESLYLPKPSESFITKYCKLNGINEVDVEYNWGLSSDEDENQNLIPKLYPKVINNKITIHSIKDCWNKEEVINIIKKFNSEHSDLYSDTINNWITKNL